MELETHVDVKIEKQLGFHELPNWKPIRVLWTTSYEMQLETHVHVQIEKQLGFHEHQIAWAITMVDKLVDGTRVYWPLYKLWDGTRNTCTCTNWKTTRVSWAPNCMIYHYGWQVRGWN